MWSRSWFNKENTGKACDNEKSTRKSSLPLLGLLAIKSPNKSGFISVYFLKAVSVFM
jgi:hypothetical protein